MGGIADYSGSLVLQRPIAEATFAAVQRIRRPDLEIISLGRPPCTIPLEALAPAGVPVSYEAARGLFSATPAGLPMWPASFSFSRESAGMPLEGTRVLISSTVPEGKGVSSSAALETATMQAVAGVFGLDVTARDIALLCQKAENLVAGAPCGVMDQMTCVFGERDRLLALLCQPAELQPPVPVPDDIGLWGIDSGERHAVGGSDYGAVRTGAFMGLRLATEQLGVPVDYLANISPRDFERELTHLLPEEMSGDAFLDRFSGTADTVTQVEQGRRYRVRASAAHPVYERERVEQFRRLLCESAGKDRLIELGALMSESHASYGACGLGSPGTDRFGGTGDE